MELSPSDTPFEEMPPKTLLTYCLNTWDHEQTMASPGFAMFAQGAADFYEYGEYPEIEEELPPEISEPARPVVNVIEYDPTWPDHFQRISKNLAHYLDLCKVDYLTIDHVGSTSVPGLAAKANIDIIIEVPDIRNAELAREALIHEPPAEEHYKCIGDGGIKGRISMKLHDRSGIPDQSVYIINTQDSNGRLVMRCHRALRDTLRKPEHQFLRDEYGQTKIELAAMAKDGVEYGQNKNKIIRRILQAAGWSDQEIDDKESLDYRVAGERDFHL